MASVVYFANLIGKCDLRYVKISADDSIQDIPQYVLNTELVC